MIIPSAFYIGFNMRIVGGGQGHLLGFAADAHDNTIKQNIKNKIDNWSDTKSFDTMYMDNTSLVGFYIGNKVHHPSIKNKETMFRVSDPRGFQLEISIKNFDYLFTECCFYKTEILDEMIWGFENNEPFLIRVKDIPKKVSEFYI